MIKYVKNDKEKLLNMFKSNLNQLMMFTQFGTLKDVELVFFPIISKNHFYLICFNLKNPAIDIIDNMKRDVEDIEAIYQEVPKMLVSNL